MALIGLPQNSHAHKRPTLMARNAQILASADDAVSEQISSRQMYQTRFNFGVNLGSCFLRELWIFPSHFPKGTDTELEATWRSSGAHFMQDLDWDWLKNNHVNSVRIPIGYWNVNGGSYTEGTRFAPYKDVYKNSWLILKSKFIEPAAKRGISVLVDLHGVPGGANPSSHNGEQSGRADFWTSPANQEVAIKALEFIAQDLKIYDNICGIQVVNEADFANDATVQKNFYRTALDVIRKQDKTVPVVISDGWWPNQWVEWIQDSQGDNFAGLVVDHHVYRRDYQSPKRRKGVDFMVAEWSCVLAQNSWKQSGVSPNNNNNDARKLQLVAEFGTKQELLIEQRAKGGSYFWTYKFESGNGGEWDFRQQLGRSFRAPTVSVSNDSTLNKVRDTAVAHLASDLAKDGFILAWNDGLLYARKGALIGRKQAVKHARMLQRSKAKGTTTVMSDWSDGYDKGLQELEKTVRGN
ncbi:hypothetical protein HF325_003914 [Metschnikowia pulcherrima]|uniref:Glycoside hydrolase family 5 domain-containing protein n=1 Tax=Metschnikowia pulcherrima TaxID=27326 RepID=A0A8H7GQD1_9ASCO|nr:hypothetical protein HF325_003914 [Metschnikowia pulcherrima]